MAELAGSAASLAADRARQITGGSRSSADPGRKPLVNALRLSHFELTWDAA